MTTRARLNTVATGTVTVACKMPHGFWLKVYDMVDSGENTPQGYKQVKVAKERGEPIKINGWWSEHQAQQARRRTKTPPIAMEGAYALTHNVPADVWEKWLEDNKDSDMVRNKLVFASTSMDTVNGMMDDHDATRSGLEPVDPDKPPADMRRIQPADRNAVA